MAHSRAAAEITLSDVSRLRAAVAAFGAVALSVVSLTGCAAGKSAETAQEKPSGLDGTEGQIGRIRLEGVALHTPTSTYWARGADVPLSLYIANTGTSADTLVNVSSPAFTGGWAVVPSNTLTPGPSASAANPFTSSASSSAPSAPSSGAPQSVAAHSAVSLGLTNLAPGGQMSPEALVLKGLAPKSSPLYPSMTVNITFTFAKAGQTTLPVPVQLSTSANSQTLPASYVPPTG